MKRYWITLLAVVLLAACGTKQDSTHGKKGSSGKTLEVLLAMDKQYYTGETMEFIDTLLRSPREGMLNPEPRFDVVNVPVSSLKNTQMFQMHRNIILCDIGAAEENKLYIHHDQWASPQVVVDIVAKDVEGVRELLDKHRDRIFEEIYNAEHKRIIKAYYGLRNIDLMKRIKKHFGFELTFGEEFSLATLDGDFAWVRKETKDFGLSVLIHTFPYSAQAQFSHEKILDRLDTTMRQHVPGPAEGSYMGTERRFDLLSKVVKMEGTSYCVETRGQWRTFGDFMGGPFVSYTLLSPDGRQVVELTGFIYCPRFDRYSKRDLLMQAESICYSIKWDEAK